MRTNSRIGITVALLAIASGSSGVFAEKGFDTVEVSGITAFLVSDEDGLIDRRDITAGRMALWNTPIGEGDAEMPSSSTFVLVEISPGNSERKSMTYVSLRVRGEKSGRTIFRDRAPIPMSVRRKLMVPFLIHGTGCEALRLDAAVDGLSTAAAQKTINFRCGS